MLKLQNVILEMIAKGDSLVATMTRLCVEVEELVPGSICSILTVDAAGVIHPIAAPSLPQSYSAVLEGVVIGPECGSCGTAAYTRKAVAVFDIATDHRWSAFKHLVVPLGLRACWSSPIIGVDGRPVGMFAFYYRSCRGPTLDEESVVQRCLNLCAIALDRHQHIMELERRVFEDALTILPNRAAFNDALVALDSCPGRDWALFIVDLDNLKDTNDTFGHRAGDWLLKIASRRIAAAAAPDRTFRIGGDEFAIILESTGALQDLEHTAERILAVLAEPADCGGHVVAPRATIGGAALSAEERTVSSVRQSADFALYHAKEVRRGGFMRYRPELGTNITRRLRSIRDVGTALRENTLDAFYQPVVRLDTREIVGLEALCRMNLDGEVLPASLFHEATKDVQVAADLTARMMALVAADVRTWLDMGIPFQHVGINVSSADMHSGMLEEVLTDAFEAENVPLKHVILEITESVYMDDSSRAVPKAIEALRAKGLRVALDDFGTGFASLTHLLTVPMDIIKIDKSFVDRLASTDASLAIIEGLIGIGEKLDVRVIAEGVETEDQARLLQAAGCKLAQGYLFSQAVDRHKTTALLLDCAQKPARHEAAPFPAIASR